MPVGSRFSLSQRSTFEMGHADLCKVIFQVVHLQVYNRHITYIGNFFDMFFGIHSEVDSSLPAA